MSKFPLWALALVCAACAPDTTDDEIARRHRDAGAATAADASTTPTSSSGSVSCYSEGAPTTTCTLPVHCCFSNYSAQHDGSCTTASCAWGTITCDGPEDCASGELCCAHAVADPDNGVTSWMLACQSGACGAAPLNEEVCHDTCTSGACASGVNSDLPRTLSVCR